ncbi:hypothetical protein [Pelagibius marinus]|uniref:hypothetical protein n=1 Tax=Pelagibius marinus TaxID=2762760 RepID=UPI0018725B91|nr:hypothetical protein [Pelagibius marinus]
MRLAVLSLLGLLATLSPAFAQVQLGTIVPVVDGGLAAIAAAGVIGGIWLTRRKK